tara:strand:- start:2946 stop:5120 length:2175 start_codon:yes stop_codon:yes gene_type:complete
MPSIPGDIWTLTKQTVSKILSDRPPLTGSRSAVGGGFFGQTFGGVGKYQALTTSGWLFSAVNLIASSMAQAEWALKRVQGTDAVVVAAHPLWSLWQQPNPFQTRHELIHASANYFEISGEIIWLVNRGMTPGVPLELWPIRPDRITVVPSATEYIKGYIYTIGSERIPLAPDDVIFIKRPSPTSEYRGMGVIESILTEIDGDRRASQWSRNFYANSALPGGIIQLEESLDDDQWEQFAGRWREQHQGVQNAHRVAILERGKFVEMKFTQREMLFIESRKLSRDIIYEAFGIPKSLVGITENVNLANALAGETTFAQRVVRPRLEMVKQGSNQYLVPLVVGSDALFLDYVDPTPVDPDLSLKRGVGGWRSGLLTRNEGRELLGQGALSGTEGDEFFQGPAGGGSLGGAAQLAATNGVAMLQRPSPTLTISPKALPGQEDVNDASDAMRDAWERRLRTEVNALIAHLERFERSTTLAAWARTKFEPSDVESYDWDWLAKHGAEVEDELVDAFFDAITAEFGEIEPSEAGKLASDYASNRGAGLLNLDSDISINRMARDRVRQATADAIANGDSLGQLSKTLREDFAFSKQRADLIARTETATALGQGEKQASLLQGRNEKRWVTQGDAQVDPECLTNEAAGWIPINAAFPSGKETIPQHPRCRCRVRSRTRVMDEDRSVEPYGENRCSNCDKLLGQDLTTGIIRCARCGVDNNFGSVHIAKTETVA